MLNKKLIGTAMLAAACVPMSALAATQTPLRIGSVLALTGDLQTQGKPALKGVHLAAKEINAAGGVLGVPMKTYSGDTQTLPQPGVSAAQQLVNANNVVGLVGAMSSGVTVPIGTTVAKDRKIPEISTASTSPKITTLDDDDYLFRTIPSDAFQGTALAQVVKSADVNKVGVMYTNNAYGDGLQQAFVEAFKAKDGEVTGVAAFEQKQTSYNSAIKTASGDGSADALVLIGYPESGQTIIRQSLEGGKFKRFFLPDGMKSTALIENLGAKYLNGSLGTVPEAKKDTPSAKHFAQAYKKAYGELPPQPYINTAYDATYLFALASQAAGTTTDATAIRDHLRDVANPPGEKIYPGQWKKAVKLLNNDKDIDWVGAAGPEDFDKNGDVAGSYGKWTIKDGKIETLKVFTPKMK